jgi:hypothetical protein
MPLQELQAALAEGVRRRPDAVAEIAWPERLGAPERHYLARVILSPGMAFTREVRRSWCEMRATRAARLTVALLPRELRARVVQEWLERGGGASSFFASEAQDFLEFLAPWLPAPSHVLSVCRFEQALYKVSAAATVFEAPRLPGRIPGVRHGTAASLVTFLAEPACVLSAAELGAALPSPTPEASHLLFAPGLPCLCSVPSAADVALWESCGAGVSTRELRAAGHPEERVRALLSVGALQTFDAKAPQSSASGRKARSAVPRAASRQL